ncbi:13288_t:CDS:1, partial [Ambispora gerdemannii]
GRTRSSPSPSKLTSLSLSSQKLTSVLSLLPKLTSSSSSLLSPPSKLTSMSPLSPLQNTVLQGSDYFILILVFRR